MNDEPQAAQDLREHIDRFDHVSIAVVNIQASSRLIALMSGQRTDGGRSPDAGFAWEQYALPGGGTLELIAAVDTSPDHFIRRFIKERGEGLHHLTFKVHDIHAAVAAAEELGFTVTGLDVSHENWKEAFVHPKSAHGVLIQLAEFPEKE
ncbi:MAG: VOC family protein [Actinomycetia bacterium]|nr:VOC family protein [Actinomycetes bacterium]